MSKLLVLAGLAICLFIGSEAYAAPGENCPYDWHPPPCGIPDKPVKSWVQQQLEGLEQYHFSAAQVAAVAAAAACVGSVGEPRVDQARKVVCAMAKGIGGFAVGMQVWESRLIGQMKEAAGNIQYVAMIEPPPMASFEFTETDNAWLNALQYDLEDHRATMEQLGEQISESVRIKFLCDAWAMYDIDGITCGHNQNAVTATLFGYMGQHVSAVSAIEDAFLDILSDYDVDQDFVDFVDYDAQVNGWEGWNFQL